jgi:hypothetical protein
VNEFIDTDEQYAPEARVVALTPSPVRYVCCTHCTHGDRVANHVVPCWVCIDECPHRNVEAEAEQDDRMASGLYRVTLTCHGCNGTLTAALGVQGLRWYT